MNENDLSLQTGQHLILLGSCDEHDQMSFFARRQGLEIRDGWMIDTPDRHFTALLCRNDLDQTILQTLVKYGSGVIDIDKARIPVHSEEVIEQSGEETVSSGDVHEGYQRPNRSMYTHSPKERSGPANPDGRFPTNRIFIHTSGCEVVGTKKVKAGNSNQGEEHGTGDGTTYLAQKESGDHYADEDGMEETLDWECEKNCPVAKLNQQSFNMGIHSAGSRSGRIQEPTGGHIYDGDFGGASRFFREFQSYDELINYFGRVIGSEKRVIWFKDMK